MILIYKQSSELLIFCVLLLNRGPTFTFKITCGKKKKKKMKKKKKKKKKMKKKKKKNENMPKDCSGIRT